MDQKKYWNSEAGQTWAREAGVLDAMLAPLGTLVVQAAQLTPGARVIDVGCGAGATSRMAAAAGAQVVGADISAPLLAVARAQGAGPDYLLADAGADPLPGPFDVLISRFGVMFFTDPHAAFAHLQRAMAPGGRAAFVCWRTMLENDWAREPLAAVAPHLTAPPEPPADPYAPGPFALADPDRTRAILAGAGWRAIAIEPIDVPYCVGEDVPAALALMSKIGPVGRLLREQPEAAAGALPALESLMAARMGPAGVMFTACVWRVTALA